MEKLMKRHVYDKKNPNQKMNGRKNLVCFKNHLEFPEKLMYLLSGLKTSAFQTVAEAERILMVQRSYKDGMRLYKDCIRWYKMV